MSFQQTYTQRTYKGLEPSQVLDVVHGGNFEHRLLSSKKAIMEHERLALHDINLETGFYDFPVVVQGGMPKEAFCIGFMAEGGNTTRYNTTPIKTDEIQIYPPGAEVLYQASGVSRWVTFIVSEERLQEIALTLRGQPVELSTGTPYSVRLPAGGRLALTRLVNDALAIARYRQPFGGMTLNLAAVIYESLLHGFVNTLFDAIAVRQLGSISIEQRQHDLITACERVMFLSMSAEVGLAEIAKRSGYSLRSLELTFQRSVGMTPGQWFRMARLNGALRDLLTCDEACTVSDIAMKWGFHHMSRFSQYYRNAFGESPRDTLYRSRSCSTV